MEQGPPRDLISDLYHRALGCTPDDRGAFLEEQCAADAALRGEVESLLRYESDSARFLETPAAVALSEPPGATDRSQMIGRQLGLYSIVAPLGSGGMGEVYRARDTKLGRDVAIKILPPHFTTDPEGRARLLATLNHPHIGAIYSGLILSTPEQYEYSGQPWLRMGLARTLNGDSPCVDASRSSSPSRASFSPTLPPRRG